MALPSWVYNQSSLPPWMLNPQAAQGARPPVVPQPVGQNAIYRPGPSPGIVSPNFFGGTTTGGATSGTNRFDQQGNWIPGPTTMQGGAVPQNNNTNPGMVGLLPPGHAGSNVPLPAYSAPTFENYPTGGGQFNSPTFENYPTGGGQFQSPTFEDDSGIYAGLGGPNPMNSQYTQLMQQLQQMMGQPGIKFNPYKAEEQKYTQDPELTNAIAMIRSLAESGGYSEQDKSELRARDVSPIRSVYANAQQGLDRTRALQGGYSPNHTAATSKLARELSDRIAGQTTNVNADIADKVAQGKMAMAPQLGNITSHVNDLINSISGSNVNARNEAGMFNTTGQFNTDVANQGNQNQLMGMIQQLFGTGASMASSDADRNVNIAGMRQRGISDRNANALSLSNARNQFDLSNRDLTQRGVESRNRNALDLSNAQNQFSMNNRELEQRGISDRNRNALDLSNSRNSFNQQNSQMSQQMQQFLQRMGLDTAQMNQAGNRDAQGNQLDWARLEQQGGLGLIQALMQMMQQQGGRA